MQYSYYNLTLASLSLNVTFAYSLLLITHTSILHIVWIKLTHSLPCTEVFSNTTCDQAIYISMTTVLYNCINVPQGFFIICGFMLYKTLNSSIKGWALIKHDIDIVSYNVKLKWQQWTKAWKWHHVNNAKTTNQHHLMEYVATSMTEQ